MSLRFIPPPERVPSGSRWRLPGKLVTSSIHEWVKTVTVAVGLGLGIYTFIYKDIWLPSQAPASLVLDVQPLAGVRAVAATDVEGQPAERAEINVRITATNPTQRPLFLLSTVWWLSGVVRQPAELDAFEEAATSALHAGGLQHAERGRQIQGTPVFATGPLFVDNRIQPGETISRDLPISLSSEQGTTGVDQLELVLIIPALTRNPNPAGGRQKLFEGNTMKWTYSDQADVYPAVCNVAMECQAADLEELRERIFQFDPDALIFKRIEFVANPL